jgi:hypothetical protein
VVVPNYPRRTSVVWKMLVDSMSTFVAGNPQGWYVMFRKIWCLPHTDPRAQRRKRGNVI